jgi:hypothetical protein
MPTRPRPPARKKLTAAKLRSWRVFIIRRCAYHVGTVEAPNEKADEAVAIKTFDLDDAQRRRLVVQEQD